MEQPTERTFSFTVKLPHSAYVKLLAESRSREKLQTAVPSRTARQLIIERLDELKAHKTPRCEETRLPAIKDDTKSVEPKKTRSGGKRGAGENGRSPT